LEKTLTYKLYNKSMRPMMESAMKRWVFIIGVTLLLLGSVSLFFFKAVTVKILPFDNKNEFQVVIDMPEGTTLEQTANVTKELAAYLRNHELVTNYQTYVGTSAPINFNGLVRHYDLRRGSNVADIQVNLVSKKERSLQSHDIAKQLRPRLQEIGKKFNANVKVVEVPPGPPVMSTMVAEIYGPDYEAQKDIARQVKELFKSTESVVDVDWMMEDDHEEYRFDVDKEKAMLAGIAPQQIVHAISMNLRGATATYLYAENDHDQVGITLRMAEEDRTGIQDIKKINLMSKQGNMVAIGDLVHIEKTMKEKSIYPGLQLQRLHPPPPAGLLR
jgi:multidrug efflux pump subunit AcrB